MGREQHMDVGLGALSRYPAESDDFRALAESLIQFVWVTEPDGRISYFNRRWIDYTGLTVDELPASRWKGVHPEDYDAVVDHWRACLRSGEPYHDEYRLRRASDGTFRWYMASALPVRDQSGSILYWIGSGTDIDEQRRANDNLRFIIEATAAFSGMRSVQAVCERLAQMAIARVADWCFVVLEQQGGSYPIVSIAHRDRDLVEYVAQFRDRYPVRAGSQTEICIRQGVSFLVPAISEDDIRQGAEDEAHLELLLRLRMHSAITVPLTADSGKTYGALVLISAESARSFTAQDQEVAERVAKRAATAIETAREFQEERVRSQRLRFIARASELMFESLELTGSFNRVCELLAQEMADLAYVVMFEPGGGLRTVAVSHRDPAKRDVAARLRGQRTMKPVAEEAAARMLAQHRTIVARDVTADHVLPHMWEYLAQDVRTLNIHSAITVPLFARGETFGALIAYWCETPRNYTDEDVPIFEDLGRRMSVAIEHAAAFERERRISVSLQHALLPSDQTIPHRPDLEFSTEYRPSSTDAEVGGDWFDAFSRADGSIVVSVGDVTGRGLDAAGLMGKLRQSIGIAAIYERDPAQILDAVDQHLRSRRAQALATAFVGIIDPDHHTITFANAGHPPPLLRRGRELIELRAEGLPLGLRDFERGQSKKMEIAGSDLLVLYTDGLLEGTRDLLFGETRLREVLSSDAVLRVRNPAKLLCDACLPRDAGDDTAVLTVRFGRRTHWQFDAENAQAATDARREFIESIRKVTNSREALDAAELIFGELVGNVVRHAPGPIDVQLDTTGEAPVLHVIDRGVGFVRDPALPSDPLSESGRGVYIIARLSKAMQVERIPGYGNHVSATLRV